MEEAKEIPMDDVLQLKAGHKFRIGQFEEFVLQSNHPFNLSTVSNRFGYVLFATGKSRISIVPTSFIDQKSKFLSLNPDDDDDENIQTEQSNQISQRNVLPNSDAFLPIWLAFNADETLLSIVSINQQTQSIVLILYQFFDFLQNAQAKPLSPPQDLCAGYPRNFLLQFVWNPSIPELFAFIDNSGQVTTMRFDPTQKIFQRRGVLTPDLQNSSISWSPKGKQLVVVTKDVKLRMFEEEMKLKNQCSPPFQSLNLPPCVNVVWWSNNQFLLGFSSLPVGQSSSQSAYCQILLTTDKGNLINSKIFNDLFYDARKDPKVQFFNQRLSQNSILFVGLSKSSKIGVLGGAAEKEDTLNIWTMDDAFRPVVESLSTNGDRKTILTGLSVSLNSSLNIIMGKQRLPPCPILILSTSDGVLQTYYFAHNNLSSICHSPERSPKLAYESPPTPNLQQPAMPNQQLISGQLPTSNRDSKTAPLIGNTTFTSGPAQLSTNRSAFPNSFGGSNFFANKATSVFATDNKSNQNSSPITNNTFELSTEPRPSLTANSEIGQKSKIGQSSSDDVSHKTLLEKIRRIQMQINQLPKLSNPMLDEIALRDSVENLRTKINEMRREIKEGITRMNNMIGDAIEATNDIEEAKHNLKLAQRENLHNRLSDRALDPWARKRLEGIDTRFEECKADFRSLATIACYNINDRSMCSSYDENDNDDDFLPDLETSLVEEGSLKKRIYNRISILGKRVAEVDHEVDTLTKTFGNMSTKFQGTKSNKSDATFTKNQSIDSSIYKRDEETLRKLREINFVPRKVVLEPSVMISTNSTTDNYRNQTNQGRSEPDTSLNSSGNGVIAIPEPVVKMMSFFRTSFDIISGTIDSEELQKISDAVVKSPLSQKLTTNSTVTQNTSNRHLTAVNTQPTVLQTPTKINSSTTPQISVTPATPNTNESSLLADASKQTILMHSNPTASGKTSQSKTDVNSQAFPSTKDSSTFPLSGSGKTDSSNSINTQTKLLQNPTVVPFKETTGLSKSGDSTADSTKAFSFTTNQPSTQTPTSSASSGSTNTSRLPQFTFGNPTTIVSSTAPVSGISTIKTTTTTTATSSPFGSSTIAPGFTAPPIGGSAATSTASPSIFGGSTTTTTAAPSLFAGSTSSTTTTPSPFGSSTAAPGTTAPSLGGSTVMSTASPSIFGGSAATTTAAPSLFAGSTSSTTTTPSPFGSSTATSATTVPPFGGSTVTSTASPSIFGGSTTTTTAAPSLFAGSTSSTTTTPSPFGSSTIAPSFTAPPFGGSTTTSTASPSIFGSSATATTAAPSLFAGSTSSTTTTPSPFGSSTTAPGTTPTPFGGSAATSTGSPSIFGGSTTTTTAAPSIFGGSTTTTTAAPSIFGGSTTTTTAAPSIFGGSTTTTTAAPSIFGGSTTTTTAAPSIFGGSTTTTTAAPSIFGGSGSTTTTAPSVFGSSTGSASSPFGASPSLGQSVFGASATNNSSGSIFGRSTSGTQATSPFAGPTTTTTPATSIFGSSGIQGAPGASPFGTGFLSSAVSTASSTTGSTFSFANALSSSGSSAGSSVFGSGGQTGTNSTSTNSGGIFGSGFGQNSTSVFGSAPSATSPTSGGAVFGSSSPLGGLRSTIPVSSPSSTSSNAPLFGSASGATSNFGSGFTGFGTLNSGTSNTNGFSFGGFGGASTSTVASSSSVMFGGNMSAANPPQQGSTFGGSLFAAAPSQSGNPGFGGTSSPFGGPSSTGTAASSSFTAYRK